MFETSRTARFSIKDGPASSGEPAQNSSAPSSSMSLLGRHYKRDVRCRGQVNPITCCGMNNKDIDRAVRTTAISAITAASLLRPSQHSAIVLQDAPAGLMHESLGSVQTPAVRLQLSLVCLVEMSPPAPTVAPLRQHLDFAAGHPLRVSTLLEADNRRSRSKCNKPSRWRTTWTSSSGSRSSTSSPDSTTPNSTRTLPSSIPHAAESIHRSTLSPGCVSNSFPRRSKWRHHEPNSETSQCGRQTKPTRRMLANDGAFPRLQRRADIGHAGRAV